MHFCKYKNDYFVLIMILYIDSSLRIIKFVCYNMHINSMNNYIHLADQIIKGNSPQAVQTMALYINDTNNLDNLLLSIEYSDNLHFIFTEMLAKSILNGEFCPINQTKSDDNSMKQNENQKIKVYSAIMTRVFNTILKKIEKNLQHIVRSGLNLISVCLKDLCQNNRNLNFVQDFMNIFFPNFKVNEDFTNNFQNQLIFIQPQQNTYIPEHYGNNIRIFNSLLQYVTMLSYYKSYYEYRRNIYTFRNTYLSIFLNMVVQYFKAIYYQWNVNQQSEQLIQLMNQTVSLLEKVVNYPFTLSLHQFQNDDQANDNIAGISGQIYFPNYFRHVILDKRFIEMVFKYYMFLLNQLQTIKPMRETVNCLTRIIGRFLSSSSYCFNSQAERKQFRNGAVDVAVHIAYNFKFYDAYYLHSLCDILCKVLTAYSDADFQGKKLQLIEAILAFTYNLVQKSQIKLEDGKRNPFNRAFDLVGNCLDESKEETYYEDTKNKAQIILEKGFARLIDNKEADRIMNEYGKNAKGQIECFQELYGNINKIFLLNFQTNIANFNSIDVSQLNQNSQVTWLHLCSLLLPSCMSEDLQTKAVLKYFQLAKNGQSLAALHYLKTLVHQVMFQIEHGVATTKLWKNIQFQKNVSFSNFIMYVIKLCKKNFNQENIDLIDYSLEVFKSIYLMLKKNDNPEFLSFYQEVKVLISSINETVFSNVKFFKKRVALFSVISIIWVNTNQFEYLYEIYNLVASGMKNQPTPLSLLKYMHDITGILQPIDTFQTFKVVGQLALIDLRQYLPAIITSTNIEEVFSEQSFLKAFCKLAQALSNDSSRRLTYITHTDLPFQIQELFKPYLIECLKYDYPKCLVTVWLKFISLNPLQNLFPLPESMKNKQSKDYDALIKEYFQNIHRIENLQVLYPYIQDNTDYLVSWWEQVMNRNLKPNISLKMIVDSRIATTKRQKQNLAKLIYEVGRYDSMYWDVSAFSTQRQFVNWFLTNYKDFKQM